MYKPIQNKKVSLYTLANWVNGLAFKDINFSQSGIPVIKISELKNGITDQTKYTQDKFDDSVRLHKGDMLFSWSGNPETSIDTFIYGLTDGWLNQHIFKVTPKDIDSKYFYYVMKSLKPTFKRIASNKQTTGLGHVTVKDLKEVEIYIPSFEKQQHIVNILGTIDDKIENNEKIIKKYEEFLRLLYLKNFSKKFINIDNYDSLKLSDLASFTGGYSYKGQELIPSKYGLLTIKNFDRNIGFKMDGFKDISVINKAKNSQYVNLFDIIVAHTDLTQNAEIIGNAEMVLSKEKYDKLIASMDLVIVRPSNYISNIILYLLLHNSEFKKHALGFCAGTTVLHLNKRALNEYVVYIPKDRELIQNIDKIVSSLIKKQALLFQQNIILKNLKNLYLKKFFN